MTGAYPSEVVRTVGGLLSPFIAMFGLYIIAHGHYGPGGGFAGGVILAVGVILPRLTLESRIAFGSVPRELGPLAAGAGMLAFALTGLVAVLAGGAFLDYAAVEVGEIAASRLRYLGILVVEIAVGLAVFGAMVLIYDELAGSPVDG